MSKCRSLEALSNTQPVVSTMKKAGHLAQDVDGWALKLQALEVMNRLASCFGKLVTPHMPPVLEHAWCMVSRLSMPVPGSCGGCRRILGRASGAHDSGPLQVLECQA